LGETNEEILQVMQDLRDHGVTMLTLGQYLQPSRHHLPVARYVPPAEFDEFRDKAQAMGLNTLLAVRLCVLLIMQTCKPKAKL
ncbi:lipoyl synthase, partial [Pasteurella multocida subsp. multocida str. Anand1_cattle]